MNATKTQAGTESYFIDYLACEDEMMEQCVEFVIDRKWRTADVITWAACGIELNRQPMDLPRARKLYAELAKAEDYKVRAHRNA